MSLGDPVHYLVSGKNRHHGEAIAAGFKARVVPAEHGEVQAGALHLVGGLQHGSLALMKQILDGRDAYVFADRAYMGGGPGSERLRLTLNAYQKEWVEVRPDDRLRALGVELQPWRTRGRHVLLVPPGEAIRELFGLGDWQDEMLARLKACTDRPIMVSVKGDARPLQQRLADCWCVVTYTSNVAVDALLAGVPAFCDSKAAAAPMAGALDSLDIEHPVRLDRELWASSLAYGQFTLDEIRSGYARAVVLGTV
jgi:hypothetical protein